MIVKVRHNNGWIFLFLAVAVFLVYGNALFNGFVYDDHYLIRENPFIRDLSLWPKVFSSDVTEMTPYRRASGYYRPVSMLYLIGMYHLWGLNVFGWHLGSIILHLANSFLVFLLVRVLARDRTVAFFTALFFAVHPIHAEAVTPVYNCMGLLSAFFALKALIAYIGSEGGHKSNYTTLAVVMYALALLCKEDMLSLPLLVFAYDFICTDRMALGKTLSRWRGYLLFLLVTGIYLAVRQHVIEPDAAMGLWHLDTVFNVEPASSPILHLLTVLKLQCIYIFLLICPVALNVFHQISAVSSPISLQGIGSAAVIAVLVGWGVRGGRRPPGQQFFYFLFLFKRDDDLQCDPHRRSVCRTVYVLTIGGLCVCRGHLFYPDGK